MIALTRSWTSLMLDRLHRTAGIRANTLILSELMFNTLFTTSEANCFVLMWSVGTNNEHLKAAQC